MRTILFIGLLAVAAVSAVTAGAPTVQKRRVTPMGNSRAAAPPLGYEEALKQDPTRIVRSEAEWKKLLTPEQFRILRGADTELACSGKYWREHRRGIYRCAACGYDLFSSQTKFESGTGWPSFFQPILDSHLEIRTDTTLGMVREEVRCARCDSHLGHVFDDGPPPTGRRYCMNSEALVFVPIPK